MKKLYQIEYKLPSQKAFTALPMSDEFNETLLDRLSQDFPLAEWRIMEVQPVRTVEYRKRTVTSRPAIGLRKKAD
jgi:hypothetical protein